ncbi:MAG: hypothetical protein IT307_08360 [Chloroflexi bacterium]|nr:hypothetical protein [Chloroflexota bacterium]
MRSTTQKLLAATLVLYGIAAIFMAIVSYNVTHEAFTSVRNFASLLKTEREKVASTLQGITGLFTSGGAGQQSSGGPLSGPLGGLLGGNRGGSSEAAPSATPSTGAQEPGGRLGEAIRGLLGGERSQPKPAATPGTAPRQESPPPQADTGGPLGRIRDQLDGRLLEITQGFGRLGDGPIAGNTLDRVELVTNLVIGWMLLHGAASIIIGLRWLSSSGRPTVVPAPWPAGPYPGGPNMYAPPHPGGQPPPRPGGPPGWPGEYPPPPDAPTQPRFPRQR